jgi:putative ABC transport system ATP-binding protein
MSEATPIVEARHLKKVYKEGHIDVHALRGVDFEIRSGEFVVLAGPSGSGKTTLLNLIGALDVPSEGELLVDGKRLESMSSAARARLRRDRIGFVFQAYNLLPVLSARENTELVLLLQGIGAAERHRRVEGMLSAVGLAGMMDRRPDELSGGQQQRVAVARAVVPSPSLVLADEPTANLDSKTADSLLELMSELNSKHNITFLFSSHDSRVIRRARRVLYLEDGRIQSDTAAGAPSGPPAVDGDG